MSWALPGRAPRGSNESLLSREAVAPGAFTLRGCVVAGKLKKHGLGK